MHKHHQLPANYNSLYSARIAGFVPVTSDDGMGGYMGRAHSSPS